MYTTVDLVKSAMGRTSDFTDDEVAFINSLIASVGPLFDRVCGWPQGLPPLFEADKHTVTVPVGAPCIAVSIPHALSITSIKTPNDLDELIEIPRENYALYRMMNGVYYPPAQGRPGRFVRIISGDYIFMKYAVVEGIFGVTSSPPNVIAQLAAVQVAIWFKNAEQGQSRTSADNERGVLQVPVSLGLSQKIKSELQFWRVFV